MLVRVSFKDRDIVSIRDFTRDEIEYLLKTTELMEPLTTSGSNILNRKILANLFFEPSTRTRLSFEAAMQKLGGGCIGFDNPETSSIKKREN